MFMEFVCTTHSRAPSSSTFCPRQIREELGEVRESSRVGAGGLPLRAFRQLIPII